MRSRVVFGLALVFVVSALVYAQSDVAGKWTGEMQGRGGTQPVTLELTVNGGTVTGTMTIGEGQPVEIQDGKLEGNTLTFSAAGGGRGGRRGGGGAPDGAGPGAGGGGGGRGGGRGGFAFSYTGKINGDEMEVTREFPGGFGGGGGGGGGRGGRGGPQTFTLKKG